MVDFIKALKLPSFINSKMRIKRRSYKICNTPSVKMKYEFFKINNIKENSTKTQQNTFRKFHLEIRLIIVGVMASNKVINTRLVINNECEIKICKYVLTKVTEPKFNYLTNQSPLQLMLIKLLILLDGVYLILPKV